MTVDGEWYEKELKKRGGLGVLVLKKKIFWKSWPHPKGFEFENFIKMILEAGHSNKTLQG